jgi:hypothetical protein
VVIADPAGIGAGTADGAQRLVDFLAAIERPRVVEVGTLRAEADRPTHHTAWAPHGDWVRVDREEGPDVDVVADAHHLDVDLRVGPMLYPPRDPFDAYVACSVWEHLERPWQAMVAAASVVRPGGLVYVQTHQTFPIHGYPEDFYRFSDKAMAVMMRDADLEVLHTAYTYPCQIVPPAEVTRWNPAAPAYLNVEALGRRPEED